MLGFLGSIGIFRVLFLSFSSQYSLSSSHSWTLEEPTLFIETVSKNNNNKSKEKKIKEQQQQHNLRHTNNKSNQQNHHLQITTKHSTYIKNNTKPRNKSKSSTIQQEQHQTKT
jgi:uncharacterized membrane protein YhiD involved in acid resistance